MILQKYLFFFFFGFFEQRVQKNNIYLEYLECFSIYKNYTQTFE